MSVEQTLYPSLDTPAVLVDMDRLEANIKEMSDLAAGADILLRPHVKVHESAAIAKLQIESGAVGIEVGSLGQAEAMTEQGINDIVIAHPSFYGGPKGEKLKRLLDKPRLKLALVVDMFEQSEIVSQIAQAAGKKVPVLIKIDLGRSSRFGVLSGEAVVQLAQKLGQLSNVEFTGIYGHEMGAKPTQEGKDEAAFEAAMIMSENARMLAREGITVEHVSVGASPTFRSTCRYLQEGNFPEITEIHPGQCVIGDIGYMKMGGNTEDSIAVTVLTTVMSTSHSKWAMIDAGYKTFGADVMIAHRDTPGFFWEGKPSFGYVKGRPGLWLGRLSAETSSVYYIDPQERLSLGQRLEIMPNNSTLVINTHDRMYGVRNGTVELEIPITARGRGN